MECCRTIDAARPPHLLLDRHPQSNKEATGKEMRMRIAPNNWVRPRKLHPWDHVLKL